MGSAGADEIFISIVDGKPHSIRTVPLPPAAGVRFAPDDVAVFVHPVEAGLGDDAPDTAVISEELYRSDSRNPIHILSSLGPDSGRILTGLRRWKVPSSAIYCTHACACDRAIQEVLTAMVNSGAFDEERPFAVAGSDHQRQSALNKLEHVGSVQCFAEASEGESIGVPFWCITEAGCRQLYSGRILHSPSLVLLPRSLAISDWTDWELMRHLELDGWILRITQMKALEAYVIGESATTWYLRSTSMRDWRGYVRALCRADELKAKGVTSIEHLQPQQYYTRLCGEPAAAAAIADGPGEFQLEDDMDVFEELMDAGSEAPADSQSVGKSQDEGEGEDADEVSEKASQQDGKIGDEVSEKASEGARTPRPAVDEGEEDRDDRLFAEDASPVYSIPSGLDDSWAGLFDDEARPTPSEPPPPRPPSSPPPRPAASDPGFSGGAEAAHGDGDVSLGGDAASDPGFSGGAEAARGDGDGLLGGDDAMGVGVALAHASLSDRRSLHQWGSFSLEWRPRSKKYKCGAWQVTCRYHALSVATRCTRTVSVLAPGDIACVEMAERFAKSWCLQAGLYTTRRDHEANWTRTRSRSRSQGAETQI